MAFKSDSQIQAELEVRKDELKGLHFEYIQEHPELNEVLTDYISSILLHKPEDTYLFTREYFTKFNPEPIANKPLIISGPSSVGKTSMIAKLMEAFPGVVGHATSVTTKAVSDEDQRYKQVSEAEFAQMEENGDLMEASDVHGNRYGVLKRSFMEIVEQNKICVLDIDVQGAEKLFMSELDCNIFFIMPPDMKSLENRMRGEGIVEEEALRKRLRSSQAEIEFAKEKRIIFKEFITNDVLDTSFEEFLRIFFRYYEHLMDKRS